MTNAPLALLKEAHISKRVCMLNMMAGGVNAENVTSAVEFNIYADPEAARVVFDSDILKTIIPLKITFVHNGI